MEITLIIKLKDSFRWCGCEQCPERHIHHEGSILSHTTISNIVRSMENINKFLADKMAY